MREKVLFGEFYVTGPQVPKPVMEMNRSVVVPSSLMLNWASCEALLIRKSNSSKQAGGGAIVSQWKCLILHFWDCEILERKREEQEHSQDWAGGLSWKHSPLLVIKLICRGKLCQRAQLHDCVSQTKVMIFVDSLFCHHSCIFAASLALNWPKREGWFRAWT